MGLPVVGWGLLLRFVNGNIHIKGTGIREIGAVDLSPRPIIVELVALNRIIRFVCIKICNVFIKIFLFSSFYSGTFVENAVIVSSHS